MSWLKQDARSKGRPSRQWSSADIASTIASCVFHSPRWWNLSWHMCQKIDQRVHQTHNNPSDSWLSVCSSFQENVDQEKDTWYSKWRRSSFEKEDHHVLPIVQTSTRRVKTSEISTISPSHAMNNSSRFPKKKKLPRSTRAFVIAEKRLMNLLRDRLA